MVYDCRGNGTSKAASLLDATSLDSRGNVCVDETLQVVSLLAPSNGSGTDSPQTINSASGGGRIFAMGDAMALAACTDLKLGHTAELNADVVAANVHHLASVNEPTSTALGSEVPMKRHADSLGKYPEAAVGAPVAPRVFCVSLGETYGILVFNGIVVEGILPVRKTLSYADPHHHHNISTHPNPKTQSSPYMSTVPYTFTTHVILPPFPAPTSTPTLSGGRQATTRVDEGCGLRRASGILLPAPSAYTFSPTSSLASTSISFHSQALRKLRLECSSGMSVMQSPIGFLDMCSARQTNPRGRLSYLTASASSAQPSSTLSLIMSPMASSISLRSKAKLA